MLSFHGRSGIARRVEGARRGSKDECEKLDPRRGSSSKKTSPGLLGFLLAWIRLVTVHIVLAHNFMTQAASLHSHILFLLARAITTSGRILPCPRPHPEPTAAQHHKHAAFIALLSSLSSALSPSISYIPLQAPTLVSTAYAMQCCLVGDLSGRLTDWFVRADPLTHVYGFDSRLRHRC